MILEPTKNKFSFRKKIVALVLALVLMFGLGFGTAVSLASGKLGVTVTKWQFSKNAPSDVNFNLLWDAWNKVHTYYAGSINDQDLVYGAVKGMVSGLDDPYTIFLNPTEAKQFNENVTGEFSGVGIEIGLKNNVLTVIAPLEDTPAAKAGIKSGDVIAKIDGVDTSNMTTDEAVTKIRGKKGTTVTLTILSKDSSDLKEIKLTRDTITVSSVKYEVKSDNIGYLRITQFAEGTPVAVQSAVSELKSKNIKGLIIDLRNNPGGYLTGAQDITSLFIESGVVVIEQEKDGTKTNLRTTSQPMLKDTPLVVLVNGGSASASEIMAGAIQDSGRGKLVGEKTYGKGSVQEVLNMSGGSSLKVTIAKWLTPKGRQINGVGITPDETVTQTESDTKSGADTQLNKALEMLK